MKTKNICFFRVLIVLFLLILSPPILAEPVLLLEEYSTDDIIYTTGIVSSISIEKMKLSVRPLKGERVVIDISPDTQIEGTRSIENLEREHRVKVWYQFENNKNTALKIEKLPDLGC